VQVTKKVRVIRCIGTLQGYLAICAVESF
jgi:hypothetical protein